MKHVHKLKKHKYPNKTEIYFCAGGCNYKVEVPLALGQESTCWQCGQPFIMNKYSLKCNEPHCSSCGRVKIKDSDGKDRYINKRSVGSGVLKTVAEDTVNDLKERLNGVVKDMSSEDI